MAWIRERAASVGIELPPAPASAGMYTPVRIVGKEVSTSGILPMVDGSPLTGRLQPGEEERAGLAADTAARNALAALDSLVPASMQATMMILHLRGYFAAAMEFEQGHIGMNEASKLFQTIFGRDGLHSREVIHTNSLPLGATCELRVQARLLTPVQ